MSANISILNSSVEDLKGYCQQINNNRGHRGKKYQELFGLFATAVIPSFDGGELAALEEKWQAVIGIIPEDIQARSSMKESINRVRLVLDNQRHVLPIYQGFGRERSYMMEVVCKTIPLFPVF